MLLLLVLVVAGGVAYNLSGLFLWVGVLAAIAVMLLPLLFAVQYIMDHTYVTNLIQDFWLELSGAHSFNDVFYVGDVCPNGSAPNASGSFLLVAVSLVQLIPFYAFGLAVAAFLLAALPATLYVLVSAGSTLRTRDASGVRDALMVLGLGLGGVLVIGLVIRLIRAIMLAEAGC